MIDEPIKKRGRVQRRSFLRIVAALCALLLLVSCTDNAQFTWLSAAEVPTAPVDAEAGPLIYRVFMPESSGAFHPLSNRSREMQSLMGMVYEGLVVLDSGGEPQPALAETWVWDGKSLTLTLRKGVSFSDGTPVRASDVTATLDAVKALGADGVYGYTLGYIGHWTAASDREVRVTGSVAAPMMLCALTMPILKAGEAEREQALVGTGPMAVDTYEEGVTLKMSRNGHWWRTPAVLDGVEALVLPDDAAAVNAFAMDRLSFVATRRLNASQTLIPGGFGSHILSTRRYEFIAVNHNHPLLGDRRMRLAIANAIDGKDIIDNVYLGSATLSGLPMHPDGAYGNHSANTASYDADAADSLLRSLGYMPFGQDGMLLKQNPAPDEDAALALTLLINEDIDSSIHRDIASRLEAQMRRRGIRLEVRELKLSDYLTALDAGDYDLALVGVELSPVPDLSFFGSGRAVTGYHSAAFDALLEDARTAQTQTELAAVLLSMQNLIAEDLPFIGLCFRNASLLTPGELSGVGLWHETDFLKHIGDWTLNE